MEEKQVIVKNLTVNCKIIGSGKPILFLHGWGSNSDRWVKIAELLAEKNLMIIIPDLPGFGKSQIPESPWSLDNYVEWLLEFSNTVPELSKDFYLLGHSFGGALAAKFSIKYSQRVTRLFLVAAACVRKRTTLKKWLYNISKTVKIFSFFPYYDMVRKAFYRFVLRKSDYPYVSGIMKETYLKVISDDLSQKLNFIKVPVVIVWGDKDESTPIDQAYFINKKIPHSSLVVIPGAGHAVQLQFPELLAEKIIDNI